jgi:hypothetical protein
VKSRTRGRISALAIASFMHSPSASSKWPSGSVLPCWAGGAEGPPGSAVALALAAELKRTIEVMEPGYMGTVVVKVEHLCHIGATRLAGSWFGDTTRW